MADGFLGRWSQRKQALREGRVVDDPAAVKPGVSSDAGASQQEARQGDVASVQPLPVAAPRPTLEDVKTLHADSSFAPFVSRDVAPEVRNAAMKKLFTDPHYNVMDGLDIYIDDYSLPSPMPAAMLRQMVSAKFLNLFEEDPPPAGAKPAPPEPVGEDANTAPAGSVAQFALTPDLSDPQVALPADALPPDTLPTSTAAAVGPLIEDTHHDHIDLRLQPDHAAGPAR
ncbi:MAG: DUF3306 domain-containing protein, partial [Betaproteobacteria bacterium HGW-Betaproteobacteria-18]